MWKKNAVTQMKLSKTKEKRTALIHAIDMHASMRR